jgi:RNA polymerase sigma-70 factor (ECF subfamily)
MEFEMFARGGLAALRDALLDALVHPSFAAQPLLAGGGMLLSEAAPVTVASAPDPVPSGSGPVSPEESDAEFASSSEETEEERTRLIALVELARKGDSDAFGMLYDHYHVAVYRFLYYRTGGQTLAEDLTSETFFRALRSMTSFRWQGKDFGAWLMTIARNLAMDHFKSGRARLEMTTDDMGRHDNPEAGPEGEVLAGLTNEILLEAVKRLPVEQRDCIAMRFLQGRSIAETAAALDRTEGAIKQLQLRAVRNLAKLMPEGLRDD